MSRNEHVHAPATTLGGMRSQLLPRLVAAVAAGVAIAVMGCAGSFGPAGAGSSGPPTAHPASPGRSIGPAEGLGEPTGVLDDATMVRIVDGDTIRVVVNGIEERVRYIGINTPELYPGGPETAAPFAQAATEANISLLSGGRLVLEKDISERDRFGRLLRNIWIERDGTWTLVNLQLVADGFARVSTFPPDVKYVDLLRAAERAAREGNRGLWGNGAGSG